MSAEFIDVKKLTIYVGEDTFFEGQPFYKAVIEEAFRLKIAGASAYKCLAGYGSEVRGKEQRFLINFSEPINLPIIVELVDLEERIATIYPFLNKNLKHGMATITDEKVLVTEYIKKKIKDAGRDKFMPRTRM